MIDKFDRIEN